MKKLSLLLLALAALTTPATANVLLTDNFGYPNGNLVGAAGSPWVAHSGAGSNPVTVTNGEARIVHRSTSSEDVNAPLSGAPHATNSSTILYSSFKVRFTAFPDTNGTYFAHFMDMPAGFGFRGRVWASISNAPVGSFRLGIGNSSLANVTSGQFPLDLATGTVYTVVTRLVLNNQSVCKLWINPMSEMDTSVTATDFIDPTNYVAIGTYGFRQGSGGGACFIDNLKIGTSFDDVAGANNPPTISAVPTQRLAVGASTGPLSITVGDTETAAGDLTVTAQSSNPTLVPNANILVVGNGSGRTVTVTPADGEQGIAVITLTVTDGGGASSSTTFTVFVGFPSISSIARQIIATNTSTAPIPFTIGDDTTAADDLVLTATSFDTSLIPVANIVFGGSGSNRTVTITPTTDKAGFSTITIVVSDGGGLKATNSFTVTVRPLLGLLLDEPFTYPDDTGIADGSTPWINHSGTFGQTKVTGGKLLLISTNSEDFNREFFPLFFPPTNGVVLYSSYKVRFFQRPTAGGDYFAHYKDDTAAGFRAKVFASSAGSESNALRLGITLNLSTITTNLLHPTAIVTNTEHTVVTRYDIGTGACALWIDPSEETDTSVSSPDSTGAITVFSFAFRQPTGAIGTFTVDDLKIGACFGDVVEARPRLTIEVSGSDVKVRWPTSAVGYSLECNTDLNTTTWNPAGGTASVEGADNVREFLNVTGAKFFRLIK